MDEKEMEDCSAPLQPSTNGRNKVMAIAVATTEQPHQVDVQFADVHYSVPHRKEKWKKILHGVTGEFRAGRLTAILGPSGAGKTSLLNLLASRGSNWSQRRAVRGSLTINGVSCCEHPELFRKLKVCYIPQEFALMPLLTCRETIYIAARLKLKVKGHDENSRNHVIQDVADRLGLLNCMDTLTSKLSGGEKKRLSIAVEMITSPSVMLLDEPTSGLDSTSSNQVINLLCSMAHTGCTVVCAVHQPSSQITCRFDDLLIMSQGRSRYCGSRERILEHFKDAGYACPPFYNLAEFVLEVVTGQRGGNYERMCSKDSMDETSQVDSNKYTTCSTPSQWNSSVRRYAVSYWEQMKVLLRRAFICILRDNTLTTLRLLAHVIVAVLLGVVFYNFGQDASRVQSNIACLFFFVIFLFFANSMPSVQMFPTEATVFLRENTNNWYSLESYYITKVLSDLPLQIICPTVFLAIGYYITGQPLEISRFFQAWLICTLFTMLAQSFGIVTGAAFDTHAGMFLVPAFNIPMFLFAGFFLKLNEIPFYLNFFSTISYFRYAFEGMMQAVYLNRPKIEFCPIEYCHLRLSKQILGELGMPSVAYSTTAFALFAWILGLHTLTYIVLRCRLYFAQR
ncbi:ATP-binding cassette sub-family G member 1 [Nasonia vitripennis]|uniref:ABC transporter domain-containing protein n=1 Tax=Nasonia vitripennis TaxID=7425 RepID=A0A7M7LJ59_NASVI|nr:ATP-binding cassette sub-family G member 1 [Nasonia vitripennis]XP_008215140.1 ATP-binding cassette sub-family G member 1 [Nasonia vitripennis]XP_032457674.1 ATP-binding cassette sub-family G member 1 [Nasonia vitripennis]XP_032457676.1 ATP-binding cassette sub-family G member 1 [Nasonia vitripennis]